MLYWEPVGGLISTILSQIILGARAYAVRNFSFCLKSFRKAQQYNQLFAQNIFVGLFLTGIIVVEVIIGGITISVISPLPPVPVAPGDRPPCAAVTPEGWAIAFWVTSSLNTSYTTGKTDTRDACTCTVHTATLRHSRLYVRRPPPSRFASRALMNAILD